MLKIVIVLICVYISVINLENIKQKSVMLDVDLQTCITNFDVHTDKIIRTQDSRNMGAKYLNEMDLDSREECLRLCCETKNCDVFVFDEKSTGSCYLFQCGPPEDFKCKFTHHANYTSAILAINRHISNLESQIKLTKHENDLSKLRVSDLHPQNEEVNQVSTLQRVTTSTLPTTIKTNKLATEINKPEKEKKCSRYQFECKSSGECIAIYNACDGIVQCADGSDESSELNCPGQSTTLKPLVYQQSAIQGNNNENNEQQREYISNPEQQYFKSYPKQAIQPLHNQNYNPEEDFLRPIPVPYNVKNPNHQKIVYESNHQIPLYPNSPIENTGDWNTHSRNLASSIEKNVFNRNGNEVRVSPDQLSSPMRYGEPQNRENYPQYYRDAYQNPVEYQSQNWNSQPGRFELDSKNKNFSPNSNNWPSQREVYQDNVGNRIPQPLSPQQSKNQISLTNSQESENLAHDLKNSKHFMKAESKSKEIVKEKIQKVEEESDHTAHQDFVEISKLQLRGSDKNDFDDGLTQTPGSAALSLTLGLIITCVMAILIACRLRVVRRRIRKGGKGYAHDADYLVNGMYL